MALKNKVALITGGASGIGLATAKVFLEEGIKEIILLDLNESSGINILRSEYPDRLIHYMTVNVSDEDQVRKAFQTALEKVNVLDIVVSAAGILDDRNWRRMFEINVFGCININLASIDAMGKHKGGLGGTIINVASAASLIYSPVYSMYATTKSAVLGLSKNLGSDIYKENTGVTVIAVCPWHTSTAMAPPKLEKLLNYDFLPGPAEERLKTIVCQRAESVGKCIVEAILDGENGSVWTSKLDTPGEKVFLHFSTDRTSD